ncbi:hypothetical protein P3T76_008777 [Phytophthora citrophthora]|uniref:Ubiquitin-like protease family profile domain-containing protein n=1 Tax=Phytophthora citrophthora TaxID=4793 RepID=A0AAD9GJG1_9STRA|nr:hypothetical protein P3T76_008777 [Phytophthora citrophthora]
MASTQSVLLSIPIQIESPQCILILSLRRCPPFTKNGNSSELSTPVSKAEYRHISTKRVAAILAAIKETSVYENVEVAPNQIAFFHELLAFQGDEWLNDMCIRLAVNTMAKTRTDVRFADASMFQFTKPDDLNINAGLRDRSGGYRTLTTVCKTHLKPLMKEDFESFSIMKGQIRQTDSSSCGVFIIHFMESYISGRVVRQPNKALIQNIRLTYFTEALKRANRGRALIFFR